MIGSARRPHRPALLASALVLTLALSVVASSCGSGDGTSGQAVGVTTAGSDPEDRADSGATPAKPAGDEAPNAGRAGTKLGTGSSGGSAKAASSVEGAQPGDTAGEQDKRDAAAEKVAARHCPRGITLTQCEALAKDAEQTKEAPSYPVAAPEDCLKAMSKGECEALYGAQKQAAESNGASVDVQACLENPTPECEAVVRPFVERQRAAEEAAR